MFASTDEAMSAVLGPVVLVPYLDNPFIDSQMSASFPAAFVLFSCAILQPLDSRGSEASSALYNRDAQTWNMFHYSKQHNNNNKNDWSQHVTYTCAHVAVRLVDSLLLDVIMCCCLCSQSGPNIQWFPFQVCLTSPQWGVYMSTK